MHRARISIRFIPGLVLGLVAVGPVVAAPSLGDIDWDSYLDWHSYTDWHSLLLIGSIVLLILALVMKGVEAAKSARESGPILTPLDRIGSMSIEPPGPIALAGNDVRMMRKADEHGRGRPHSVSSPELSTVE